MYALCRRGARRLQVESPSGASRRYYAQRGAHFPRGRGVLSLQVRT